MKTKYEGVIGRKVTTLNEGSSFKFKECLVKTVIDDMLVIDVIEDDRVIKAVIDVTQDIVVFADELVEDIMQFGHLRIDNHRLCLSCFEELVHITGVTSGPSYCEKCYVTSAMVS